MSGVNEMFVIQDEKGKILAMGEKRDELEAMLLRMKVKTVLDDLSVKEDDFYQRLQKVNLNIKAKYIYDQMTPMEMIKKQDEARLKNLRGCCEGCDVENCNGKDCFIVQSQNGRASKAQKKVVSV
jgi:hypothetical protein